MGRPADIFSRFLFESDGFPQGIGLFLNLCHLLSYGLNLSGQLSVPRFHLGGLALDTFELAVQFPGPLLLLRQQALKIQPTSLLRLVLLRHHAARQQERAEDDCRKRNLLADRHALTVLSWSLLGPARVGQHQGLTVPQASRYISPQESPPSIMSFPGSVF